MRTALRDRRIALGAGAAALLVAAGVALVVTSAGPDDPPAGTAATCAKVRAILARQALHAQDPQRAQRDAAQRAIDEADLQALTTRYRC